MRQERRKDACHGAWPAEDFVATPNSNARVVEWQTRTFEGRMPKGMRVQVPPRALLGLHRGVVPIARRLTDGPLPFPQLDLCGLCGFR